MGSPSTPSEEAEEKPSRQPRFSPSLPAPGALSHPSQGQPGDTSPCSRLSAPGPADPNPQPAPRETSPAAARPPPGRGRRASPTAGSSPEERLGPRNQAGSGAPHLPLPPPPPLAAPRPRWRRRPPSPRAPPRALQRRRARAPRPRPATAHAPPRGRGVAVRRELLFRAGRTGKCRLWLGGDSTAAALSEGLGRGCARTGGRARPAKT